MEFCEKCGGVILINEKKAACAGCGRRIKKKPKIEALEKVEIQEFVKVIKEDADNTSPVIDIECPKCKNKKAYFWTMQTRAGDESETKFYKCTKCKHTWRKYR